jgi:hypothetical protein
VNQHLQDKFETGILVLRPFGTQIEDLHIDFNTDLSPSFITKLISSCTTANQQEELEESFFWNLTIGQRIECLVKISMSDTSPYLLTVLKCQEKGCSERFELRLSYANVFLGQSCIYDDADNYTINISGNEFRLRRPTGFDQLSWQKLDHNNQIDLLKCIVKDLVSHNSVLSGKEQKHLTIEDIEQIGNKMSEVDPLIDYKIKLECPYCKIENSYEVDLENISLRKLRQIQRELLYTLHELASHYHWTEKEVLAIPDVRRKLYLSMIETGNA